MLVRKGATPALCRSLLVSWMTVVASEDDGEEGAVGEEGAGDGGTGVPPTASVFAGSGAVGLPEQADTLSRAIRMKAIGGAG